MADNITLDTMTGGSVVATDDVGGVHYQLVKISGGALDSAFLIPADATFGLGVDIKRFPTSSPLSAVSLQKTVNSSFTRPADTTAYAAGDAVSNSTSSPVIITFDAVARANGGSGIVIAAVMTDSANQATKGIFELWLFDNTITATNDNAAFSMSDADNDKLVGIIQFNSFYVGNAGSGATGNSSAPVQGLGIPFTCQGGVDDIYGQLVVRNAYTPVSAETFTFRLQVIQN